MEKIKSHIESLLGEEFVLLDIKEDVHSGLLKLTVDSEQAISLETTTNISRMIQDSELMDEFYPEGYRLEVSSPGVGSPLTMPFQFKKNVGRTLSVQWMEDGVLNDLKGKLESMTDDALMLSSKKMKKTIPFQTIEKAKVVITF